MAEISIGDAVGAGFGLIRRRPGAVLLWGLVETAMVGLTVAALMPMYAMMVAQMAQAKTGGAPVVPNVAAILPYQMLSYLLNFVGLFVLSVLNCAIFRCLVHPDRSSFGGLRLGATELLFAVLTIGAYIAFFIAFLIVTIPAVIIIGVLSAVHAGVVAAIVGVAFGAAAVWAAVYAALRLSMVGPMMVDDGKVHITDAWALTKGKAGSLFLIALGLVAVIIVLELIGLAVVGALGFGAVSVIAGGEQAIPALFKQPLPAVLARLAPLIAAGGLLLIPLYGAVVAIMGAPWARAYLDLRHNPADAF